MISLKPHNTFRLEHYCEVLHFIHSERDLLNLCPFEELPLVIGGGSNILLTKDQFKPVLINEIKGKEIVETTASHVVVKLGGGENWHESVLWAVQNNLGGIENLSLIPGKCGAAPIQNIGAYGTELKDVFVRLDAIDMSTGSKCYFDKSDCLFGYRDSIFKSQEKGRFFILHVYLELTLPGHHSLTLEYGKVKETLQSKGLENPTISDVSDAVIEIRKSKLPDPSVIPNCGSFFKNPIISNKQFEKIKIKFPNIPSYPHAKGFIKVPAGWLIEQCGWKGKINNGVGTHKDHALVICNYEAKYGRQIENFYKKIVRSVSKAYGIILEPEVNLW